MYVTFLSSRFRLLAAWYRWLGKVTMYVCMYVHIYICI